MDIDLIFSRQAQKDLTVNILHQWLKEIV